MLTNDDRTATTTRPGRRWRGRRIAAGLLSAAAVAGLATGVQAATSGPALAAPPAQLGSARLDAADSPWSAVRAQAGMPRYYVLGQESKSGGGSLQVRSSATGQVISSVSTPAACDPKSFKITTADDRNFVVGCDTPRSKSAIAFYRFRITSRGQASGLTPLAIRTPDDSLDGAALSPDGRKLAITMQGFGGVPSGPGALEVVTLATGATRTWTGSSPYDLSWAGNGRELGLFESSGLYTLNVTAAGSKLNSAHLVLSRTFKTDGVQTAKLSPDGRTIIASVTYDLGNQPLHRGTVVGGIIEISARTGKQLGTLQPIHAQYSADGGGSEAGWFATSCLLGPSDPSGNHLLVSCDHFGRLDRGRFTALPGVPAVTYFNAAW